MRRFSSRPSVTPSVTPSSRPSARPVSRLLVTALASAAALAAVPAAAQADTGPTRMPPPPFGSLDAPGLGDLGDLGGLGGLGDLRRDHLTVSVSDSGTRGDGTYELECGPAGGTHADPEAACARLDELAGSGQDPFAPVPKGAYCTMQYGGDATAHITGTWHGKAVDASYKLTDGCEISRWRRLVPVLPATAS
ncbi:SSI family serine proteinase inhibitor [Streptomyces sp. NPDC102406]|uniref:SSI family serine proteinase inhibitor n=1 Tax=Streptomyces sp. NPDC102406 TaxID=3366171 RepID=UPI0037F9A7A2